MRNVCVIKIHDFKKICFHLSTGQTAERNKLKLGMYVH